MESELWKAIQKLFDRIETCFEPFGSAEIIGGDAASENYLENNNIVQVRYEIRKEFDLLRMVLSEYLSEQETYLVIFPLVVYFDELVRVNFLKETQLSWPLLQKELYEIDEGGDYFYDTLDNILRKPQTPQFVFEVYYLCLKLGFQGKYVDDPTGITKYLKKLNEKISVLPMEPFQIAFEDTGQIRYFISPLWYYGISVFFIVASYLVLRLYL